MTNVTKTANEYFLTQAQFDTKKQAGTLEVGAVYHITDVHSQDMFIKVYTTTTMNTSTLPAIAVPALTAQQVATIQTAASQGKEVTIDATHNGITNQLKVLESDHDGSVGGIRVTYYNNYVDYTLDGNQVTATYTPIGGSSGGSLYLHQIGGFRDNGTILKLNILSTSSDPINTVDKFFASCFGIISGWYLNFDDFNSIVITGFENYNDHRDMGDYRRLYLRETTVEDPSMQSFFHITDDNNDDNNVASILSADEDVITEL